jgi:hypothetical protein
VVIEHVFVTTLDAQRTMEASIRFLQARGFQYATVGNTGRTAFPVGVIAGGAGFGGSGAIGEWTTLEMRRGAKNAARAKNIAELPQAAHVHWDRGRVTVLLTIEPSYTWGGSTSTLGLQMGAATGDPKKMTLHTQMLMAIATGLEQVLVGGTAPEFAAQPWALAEAEARRLASARTRRNWIIFGVIMTLFAGVITLIAMNA